MTSTARNSALSDSSRSERDFDYGVGDDIHNAVEQLRAEIATRIRQAAHQDPMATSRDRFAYEMAARIAESVR